VVISPFILRSTPDRIEILKLTCRFLGSEVDEFSNRKFIILASSKRRRRLVKWKKIGRGAAK
jgi:hypothetical protein